MGDEDGEVSAPRKRARPFLFEIAKEKYELYRIEVEQQKQQQQRQHQMMLLQQQTKKLARGQNCSSLPYPPNMGPTSGMGSNHAGINSNVSYMELPNVADHTLTRTPEWQSMWRSPPTFTRPLEIGAFKRPLGQPPQATADPPPVICADISLVGSDLNEHFEAGAPTQELSEDGTIELEGMLRVFGFELESESIGFITYRNNLNKIMATPYERNSWKMKVYRIRNTVHLEVIRVDEQESEFHLRTQHWGRQFEALCKGQSSPSEKMEHCAIFKAKLNSHRLVIAAEVDACQVSSRHPSCTAFLPTVSLTYSHRAMIQSRMWK